MSIIDDLGFLGPEIDKGFESIKKTADAFKAARVEMMVEIALSKTQRAINELDNIESFDVKLSTEQSKLEQLNLPYAELLRQAANNAAGLYVFQMLYERTSEIAKECIQIINAQLLMIDELHHRSDAISEMNALEKALNNAASVVEVKMEKYKITTRTRAAANIRHSRPGGSREKQEKIRQIWATGKFTSRDKCAIQECDALEMSYEAARKALRNTPDPT